MADSHGRWIVDDSSSDTFLSLLPYEGRHPYLSYPYRLGPFRIPCRIGGLHLRYSNEASMIVEDVEDAGVYPDLESAFYLHPGTSRTSWLF